ncbi:MAG: hypothetical protein KIB08_06300 [Negativicoccus succinicivorans]|uniref:hypothetical protein n=1 Tax=Negativicoccus succinicivorans TaxID=620903 RepID=UPI0026F322BE|nr:hypothetical protein [Negativicoccus succinicivorans]MBS5888099.1 hypothetical protein [Negativicoccus succinicivorans]
MTEIYIIERVHVGTEVEALYIFEDREKAIEKYLKVEKAYIGVDKYFINLCRLTIRDGGMVTAQDYYEFYSRDFEDDPPKNAARSILKEINEIIDFQKDEMLLMLNKCGELLSENEKLKGIND